MSSDFRPEPQDGFSSYDRDLHDYHEGTIGGFDDDYYGDDGETPDFEGDDGDDGPSEFTEWMDFDPDC